MIPTTSDVTTRGLRVRVSSQYVVDRSDPGEGYYFFSYQVRITNEGDQPVRLLRRHWHITDGDGREQEVEGPGVVGHRPYLRPRESFDYESFCPLPTPVGMMRGTYTLVTDGGEVFDVEIGAFTLAVAEAVN